MKYRSFGNTGIKVSALGFGTMRLPVVNGENECINEQEAISMIRYAIDHGVNYMDTAYMYHEGKSEIVLGKALKNGYREKVYIADKLALWGCKKYEDLDNVFNTQLERLDVDCIDFYMVHCLQRELWEKKDELGLLKWCDNIRKSGKIRHLGFSFHDSLDMFKTIIDSYDWEFCQIQYNYMNEDVQAGTDGLRYAANKGLPIIVMEPLLGGILAQPPTNELKELWSKSRLNPASTALHWLWDKPEVTIILSGMSTMQQVKDNINSANSSGIKTLDKHAKDTINKAVKAFKTLMKIPCTKCNYCMAECPKGINIPTCFEHYNFYEVNKILSPMLYSNLPEEKNASNCIQCKKCEKKCPQDINISSWMPKVHELLRKKDN